MFRRWGGGRRSERREREYREAESALLGAAGISWIERSVPLAHLGGHARVLEAGSGPPVLFVPGIMTGGAVFADLVGRLSDFRCIMLDRPGSGLSPNLEPAPRSRHANERVADQLLVDVLDGLSIDHAHVVSTSLGGFTTFRSLAAHPQRFLRVVALAFQMGAPVEFLPRLLRLPPPPWVPPRVLVTPKMFRLGVRAVGMGALLDSGRFSDELVEWMAATLRYTETFRNDVLNSPRPIEHAQELLDRVASPVHLFWGTEDLFAGAESATTFAARLPRATLELVEGANHAPWLDALDRAETITRNHLRAD